MWRLEGFWFTGLQEILHMHAYFYQYIGRLLQLSWTILSINSLSKQGNQYVTQSNHLLRESMFVSEQLHSVSSFQWLLWCITEFEFQSYVLRRLCCDAFVGDYVVLLARSAGTCNLLDNLWKITVRFFQETRIGLECWHNQVIHLFYLFLVSN